MARWSAVAALSCLLTASTAEAKFLPCDPLPLSVEGLKRVSPSVIDEVLPRAMPACLTDEELAELERRLWSLGIFDSVQVRRHDDAVAIKVREKWTLIPGADLSIGRSISDSFVLLSLAEANLFGRAQVLYAYGAYVQRQLGGEISWWEHESAARRVTFEAVGTYLGSDVFFEDDTYAWTRRRAGGKVGVRLPFAYGSRWRLAVLGLGYHERSTGSIPAALPNDGAYVALGTRIAWEGYEWHDLAPKGFRLLSELLPGGFIDGDSKLRNRSSVTVQGLSAIRLTDTTGMLVNTVVEGANPGDPNHSHLLGTIRGVRGLPDNLYRDAAHAFTNVELRFATELVPRWYLQGVFFSDAAAYVRMNEVGRLTQPGVALGAGIGVRIVPTVFALVVPRLDVGSLLWPAGIPFFNFGFSQYF